MFWFKLLSGTLPHTGILMLLWFLSLSLLDDWKEKDRRRMAIMILSSFPVQLEEYWHHALRKDPQSMKCKHLGSSFPPDSSAITQPGVNGTHLTEQERDVLQPKGESLGMLWRGFKHRFSPSKTLHICFDPVAPCIWITWTREEAPNSQDKEAVNAAECDRDEWVKWNASPSPSVAKKWRGKLYLHRHAHVHMCIHTNNRIFLYLPPRVDICVRPITSSRLHLYFEIILIFVNDNCRPSASISDD